ncbi:transcriptional regulator, ArgR family [Hathewaya proteolytica DSM 3090]|uniref:Arginine repressor n=1 Tax=Hathewaya proteolytica DSM 3090 TaxID=1121331 RepID=A0A1M6L426_9CLOT|nr:hypothetical protein [Hathewaya proteolytica]SHJ65958.1 transcriptional regulator, ArgR family [Hathewaya proteolytica DSM 3090]
MKNKRQQIILETIENMDIETQEELGQQLKLKGIDTNQSTISRDIKELRLTKVLSNNKKYKYTCINVNQNEENRYVNILENTVNKAERVDKFVMVTTISGSGAAAGEAIDRLGFKGIVGSVAGDNTILILFRNEESAEETVEKIRMYIKN